MDQSDINKAVNKAGSIVGKFTESKVQATGAALSPYNEVFGLERFRETELIHGRFVDIPSLHNSVCAAALFYCILQM